MSYIRSAETLPMPPSDLVWTYERCIRLGVHNVELPGTEPEPVILGLVARGYYIWQLSTDT